MNIGDPCPHGKHEFDEKNRPAINAIYRSEGWVCIGEFCYYCTDGGCLKTEMKIHYV